MIVLVPHMSTQDIVDASEDPEDPSLVLPPDLQIRDLVQIRADHRGGPYESAILQLLAIHPAVTESFLREVVASGPEADVLDAVATSPYATGEILRVLSMSEHDSVREHAALGIFRGRLSTVPVEEIGELLGGLQGDDERSPPFRMLIALSPRTPRGVLEALLNDDVDAIRRKARERILALDRTGPA